MMKKGKNFRNADFLSRGMPKMKIKRISQGRKVSRILTVYEKQMRLRILLGRLLNDN
jgi:hypothetical protein